MSAHKINILLIIAAMTSVLSAVSQLLMILGGVPAYENMGAGKVLTSMVAAGSSTPAMLFSVLALLLFIAACYALSGAGVFRKLPALRGVLLVIGLLYCLRGGYLVYAYIDHPHILTPYLYISSVFYFIAGLVHIIGTIVAWEDIYYRPNPW